MSFRRGGRGGAAGGGFGSTLPFGLNYSDIGVINNETTEMPQIPFPVNGLMNTQDKEIGVHYINLNNLVRNGPFYTGDIQPESEIEKLAKDDGIQRYSDRFSKKKKLQNDKIIASVDEHPYQLELFPQELYSMMKVSKKKSMQLSKLKSKDEIFMGTKLGLSNGLQKNGSAKTDLEEAFESIAENLDDNKDEENANEEEGEEEDLDDQFDDDEDDDMDDDYNGEKYFDNGEDDEYGDEDNGDEPAF